jgi:hypothetical protein
LSCGAWRQSLSSWSGSDLRMTKDLVYLESYWYLRWSFVSRKHSHLFVYMQLFMLP